MSICGYGCVCATFSAPRASLHPAPSFQLKCHVTPASSQTSFTLRTRHLPSSGLYLIWTLPLLDFCKTSSRFSYFTWRAVQMEICLTVYRFWRGKSPICMKQSTVAYVWRDYITPCTMNAMGIWCVLWLVAFALTSAAPKSHKRLLENTNEQKDTLQVEKDNQENILSQVRISSPALDSIISVQLLY